MQEQPWGLVIVIVFLTLLGLVGTGALIRFAYSGSTPAEKQAVPISTLLGIAILGVIALVCVSGIAYGLNVGQTGSIEVARGGQTTPQEEPTTPDGKAAQAKSSVEESVADQGVVSSSQGLGILATIASAAVGGIAGVLVQRQQP